MIKKRKDDATNDQSDLVDAVTASAQQIWQAGLGAFAKAQQGGSELFDKLVQEGAQLHQLTEHLGGGAPRAMADKVSRLADNVGRQASGSWEKIEKIFDDRVARALQRIGAPARAEVDALRQEVDALKATLAQGEMKAASTPARRAPAAKARPVVKPVPKATAKPVAKRAVAKAAARHT